MSSAAAATVPVEPPADPTAVPGGVAAAARNRCGPTSSAGYWLECVGALIAVVSADALMLGREAGIALGAGFLLLAVPGASILAIVIALAGAGLRRRPPSSPAPGVSRRP
jgi:hypothetical protein